MAKGIMTGAMRLKEIASIATPDEVLFAFCASCCDCEPSPFGFDLVLFLPSVIGDIEATAGALDSLGD